MRKSIVRALLWKLGERGGTQLMQLVVMIVLTRIISPEGYGQFALVMVVLGVATLLVDSGFYEALVQAREVDEATYSTVLYVQMALAGLLYTCVFIAAPMIADFFHNEVLILLLRVAALSFFCSAWQSVLQAKVARSLQFHYTFRSNIAAVALGSVVGLALAQAGAGVWALVWQQLVGQCFSVCVLIVCIRWWPARRFSWRAVSRLFTYGWRLACATVLYQFYTQMQSGLVGRLYGETVLGFYSRGMQLPNIVVSNVNGSLQTVLFPVLAQQQTSSQLRLVMRRGLTVSTCVLFPMLAALVVVAEPLVVLLFTKSWLQAVPFLQLFCLYYALLVIGSANLQALKAMGRSRLFLKLELLKCLLGLFLLLVAWPFGVYAVAGSVVVNRLLSVVLDAYPSQVFLRYGIVAQLRDVLPTLLLVVVMVGAMQGVLLLDLSGMALVMVQLVVGAIVYSGLAFVWRVESFMYVVKRLRWGDVA